MEKIHLEKPAQVTFLSREEYIPYFLELEPEWDPS